MFIQIHAQLFTIQVLLESDIILLVWKYSVLGSVSGRNIYQKLWPLLYKRAELDMRLKNTVTLSLEKVLKIILVLGLSWPDANEKCKALGARLPVIMSPSENAIILISLVKIHLLSCKNYKKDENKK